MGDNMLPFLAMVLVQIGFAGMNITSKLAMDSGMNPLVLVSYRQLFASVFLLPVAFFLERKTRPAINRSILLEILLCSVLGATGNQLLFFLGLKLSTPTIASALNNVLPAITFILAVPFRLERVGWKEKWGQAKLIGTMVCVGGAMILSFYHGGVILIGESHLHFKLETTNPSLQQCSNSFIGPMLVIASCICWAGWLIVQARLSERFPAPYTTTGLMCFMASIQCVMAGAFSERRVSGWSLSSHARLIASVYAGVVGSALAYCLMSWCIQRKGPLYVSVFSPLLLVIVAVLSWALLQETLYTGTLLGSLLIVVGLYAVLWGKDCEALESRKKVENGGEEKEGGEKGENV